MRDLAESSCLGPSPQFHPTNYSISPNNHCVNHNYMEPGLVLTMKTPVAPSPWSSLLYRGRAILATGREDGESMP